MSIEKETSSIFIDQARFMSMGGQEIDGTQDLKQVWMYAGLIDEESLEFNQAFWNNEGPDIETIKEAVDVIVVAAGYLISTLGVKDAQKAWDAVYASNLSKVVNAVEKREDGKILKSYEYKKVAKKKLMETLSAIYGDVL